MQDRSTIEISRIPLVGLLPEERISKNFFVSELVKSETATRLGIKNWFETERQVQNAVFLTRTILQPIRDAFGVYMPNSVFRSQAVERGLKKKPKTWKSTSQHTQGEAADIELAQTSNLKLAEYIAKRLDFDQLILEYWSPNDPAAGWVHVSTRLSGGNRKEILRFDGTSYEKGLI